MHYGKKNQLIWIGDTRLRNLLEVKSGENCVSEIEDDSESELFKGRSTDAEEDDELNESKDDANFEDFVKKDGKTGWSKKKFR